VNRGLDVNGQVLDESMNKKLMCPEIDETFHYKRAGL
jgi:hypothetical protein